MKITVFSMVPQFRWQSTTFLQTT